MRKVEVYGLVVNYNVFTKPNKKHIKCEVIWSYFEPTAFYTKKCITNLDHNLLYGSSFDEEIELDRDFSFIRIEFGVPVRDKGKGTISETVNIEDWELT